MSIFTSKLAAFTDISCNRKDYLKEWLTQESIPFSEIPIEQRIHIQIKFPLSQYNPQFKMKTVIAHYDRAENTPGANDNSAAIFQIITWVKQLLSSPSFHNTKVIFTDGEELGGREEGGATAQGSYALASLLRKSGQNTGDVYVLDGCGRGDVIAVSTTGKNNKGNVAFNTNFNQLFQRACEMARRASGGHWVTLPVPYSDNAGFIANGIPSVAITVLPSEEASLYMRQLQKDKNFANTVLNHGVIIHGSGFSDMQKLKAMGIEPAEALLLSEKLPRTWRMMHTPFDDLGSLTPETFSMMDNFLHLISDEIIPL